MFKKFKPEPKMEKYKKYLLLRDCAYCHTNTPFTEIHKNPRAVKCDTCGLYRSFPRITPEGQAEVTKDFNLKINKEVRMANLQNQHVIEGYSPAIRTIAKYHPHVFEGGRVLDVGCAEGEFVMALKQAGVEAVGLEPIASEANCGRECGLDIRHGRYEAKVMESYFEEHSFDMICFMEAISYMPDWREVFRLTSKYLKPNGGIYIKASNARSIYYLVKGYDSRKYYHGGVGTRSAFEFILQKEGYEVNEVSYWFEDCFHTLGWKAIEHYYLARLVSSVIVRFLHAIDRGERIVVCASKSTD